MTNFRFVVGQQYVKEDIYRICNVQPDKQKGNWNTGYTQWNGEWFIFCNLGTAGRVGPDHGNHFEDGLLHWHGKSESHVGQESIQSLLSRQRKVHVFCRTDGRSPFQYAGEAVPASFQRTKPVQINWSFEGGALPHEFTGTPAPGRQPQTSQASGELRFPEEVAGTTNYVEGALSQVWVNAYERSTKAVSACKAHHGTTCFICSFDFGKVYGEIGRGYIHVHHLVQLADIGKNYRVDPVKDLRPVCPNCHSMLHQRRPPLSIDELKKLINRS